MYSLFLLPIILEILDVNIVVLFHNRGFRGPGNPPPQAGRVPEPQEPKRFFLQVEILEYCNTIKFFNFNNLFYLNFTIFLNIYMISDGNILRFLYFLFFIFFLLVHHTLANFENKKKIIMLDVLVVCRVTSKNYF